MPRKLAGLIMALVIVFSCISCGRTAAEGFVQKGEEQHEKMMQTAENNQYVSDIEELKAYIEAQEVAFLEEGEDIQTLDAGCLGDATLTLDDERKVAVTYMPLAGPFAMELEDAEGNTWRLDIPENALPYVETVSMQLTSDIQSDIVSGKLDRGVVLLPEGVQFTIPATLTVTGPLVSENTCVFEGDSNGKSLDFALAEVKGNQLAVTLEHFSSQNVYTPETKPSIEELADMAYKEYREVLKEVKAFLKTPIEAPPVPPDYTFTCKDEDGENADNSRNRALDMYVNRVWMPEREMAYRLLATGRKAAQLGVDNDGIYYAGLLMERCVKKVDKLIATYKYDPEKLIPVAAATFTITRHAALLGADIEVHKYLEIISDWTVRALDEQIRKIREEHNYKVVGTVIALTRNVAFFGSESNELIQEYLEKLRKAMTFTVNYDVSLFSGIANQKMALTGEAKVYMQSEPGRWLYYGGKGEGKYLSYSNSRSSATTINFPNDYPVEMEFIHFKPCTSKTVDVWVSTIGADKEVWYNKVLDMYSDDEYNFVNFMAEKLFKEYKCSIPSNDGSTMQDGYMFSLPFKNGSAIMASEGFTKTDTISYPEEGNASGSVTYVIEVRHTPQ